MNGIGNQDKRLNALQGIVENKLRSLPPEQVAEWVEMHPLPNGQIRFGGIDPKDVARWTPEAVDAVRLGMLEWVLLERVDPSEMVRDLNCVPGGRPLVAALLMLSASEAAARWMDDRVSAIFKMVLDGLCSQSSVELATPDALFLEAQSLRGDELANLTQDIVCYMSGIGGSSYVGTMYQDAALICAVFSGVGNRSKLTQEMRIFLASRMCACFPAAFDIATGRTR